MVEKGRVFTVFIESVSLCIDGLLSTLKAVGPSQTQLLSSYLR